MILYSTLSRVLAAIIVLLLAVPAQAKQECLSAKESREAVAANHLLEPLQVMKNLTSLSRSEPVSIKLCRAENNFVYDVVLLHKDGKLLRVFVDGASGRTVNPKQE